MTVRLALLMFACAGAAAAADETTEARAARFYAAGLEVPLFHLRSGVMLVHACSKRLRRGCDEQQRELAVNDRTLLLLDELTLFPQRPTEDPATGISKARELRQKISETSAALLRAAGDYDRTLFARYGASLRACPGDDAAVFRESLEALVRTDLTGFQALGNEDLVEASASIARNEEFIASSLKTPDDCLAARRLGHYLMQLMDSKLQPWIGEKKRVENSQDSFQFGAPKIVEPTDDEKRRNDRELAHAVAGNFVMVLATELHLTVYPASESRIKAIAGAIEAAP